jgi:hypothetical protein
MSLVLTIVGFFAALPQDPGSLPTEEMQGYVQLEKQFRPVLALCEQRDDLVFVASDPPALFALNRQDGGVEESLPLKAAPPTEPEYDCGMGSCFFEHSLESKDGKERLLWSGRRSNYYGSWAPQVVLKSLEVPHTWRAICPGERPLMVCFTERRTVQVEIAGDRNDEPMHFTVDYVATPPGVETRDTLHLSRGRVVTLPHGFVARFSNKGYRYVLSASSDPSDPGATLTVEAHDKKIQTEPCIAYGLWPQHLAWAAAQK